LDQKTYTKDDAGGMVDDEDDDDAPGFGTQMVASGTIGMDEMEGILSEKRAEREAEAEKHRAELRKRAQEKEAANKARVELELQVCGLVCRA
jgi:hypothetical protein